MTAGRRLIFILAADIAGHSLCPHPTPSIVDRVAWAFQLREIHRTHQREVRNLNSLCSTTHALERAQFPELVISAGG